MFENVLQSEDGAAQFSVSPRGHVAYVEGAFGADERRLVMVDRTGLATPLAAPPRPYHWPRISPDGQNILVTIEDSTPDLWLFDLRSSALTQITFDAGATFPVWSRDGRRVVYTSARGGAPNLFMATMPRPGPGARLAASPQMQIGGSWTDDDDQLAYVERRPDTGRDILLVSQRDSRSARAWLASAKDESAPRISPDGRLIAYVSNETGREEVYLRSRLQTDRATLASTAGGSEPVWSANSRELFYRAGDAVMAAAFDERGAVRTRLLFRIEATGGTIDSPNFDVMPDGQRFIMIQQPPRAAATLHVLMNWLPRPRAGSAR
jgi:Tol biopolymer transport system component